MELVLNTPIMVWSLQATVAAFAASEGHSHPRVVELPKTEEGLGFNVMGGKEQNSPIYISRLIPGGLAERHGGLKRGDQLLSVNGVVCIAYLLLPLGLVTWSDLPDHVNQPGKTLYPIYDIRWICIFYITNSNHSCVLLLIFQGIHFLILLDFFWQATSEQGSSMSKPWVKLWEYW